MEEKHRKSRKQKLLKHNNMEITAKLNYLHISPRKVRLVADLIRGKQIEEAHNLLRFTVKKASDPMLKLLMQAQANAKNNFKIDPSILYISKVTVDEGPKYKRWRARARGRAAEIQKKTSHITMILTEKEGKIKKLTTIQKSEKKEKTKNVEKPKIRPQKELTKSGRETSVKKIFRRKSF